MMSLAMKTIQMNPNDLSVALGATSGELLYLSTDGSIAAWQQLSEIMYAKAAWCGRDHICALDTSVGRQFQRLRLFRENYTLAIETVFPRDRARVVQWWKRDPTKDVYFFHVTPSNPQDPAEATLWVSNDNGVTVKRVVAPTVT
jgi:hypothetical protein